MIVDMLKKFDQSPQISQFLRTISTAMAKRRGLPMLMGTLFLIASGLCFAVVIPALVISDNLPTPALWLCLPLALFYVGVIIGFIGFMLATPLGEEYRSG